MANTLTVLIDKLLAQGLMALRQNTILPTLINHDYDAMAGEKGSTVEVPIPAPIAVQDVAPGATPPSTADIAPSVVILPMDKWKEAPFYLTDKEIMEAQAGVIPMHASEAVKSLLNQVEADVFANYKEVYGYAGAAGTTPFVSDVSAWSGASGARTILNKQLCPMADRRVLLGPDAEANAISLQPFQNMQWRGDNKGIIEGEIGRKLGADWYMDQNIPTHTSTVFTAGACTVNGVNAVGAGSTDNGRTGTVSLAKATNTSPLVKGDIISIAGDPQTYTVMADVTLAVGNTTVSISPALKKATVGAEAVTLRATHVVNLAFHRGAFAFANRPLAAGVDANLGSVISSMSDSISKLSLRLEVRREHKRTRYSYDMLYGSKLIRPELACRIAG